MPSVVVQPHWSTVVEMVWSGQRHGAGCNDERRQVPPGAYTVQAAMVEGEPAASDFELSAARVPEPRDRDDDRRRSPQT